MAFEQKEKYYVDDLVAVVRRLREPGGCPWDMEQTHASIRKNLLEEAYEVAEAIDDEDSSLLCEELGDLLLQIVLHARMEEEAGRFSFDDVCDGICKKLVYRHPHVFGDVVANDTDTVLQNWEALKNEEKSRDTVADRLDSVPKNLPALMRAEKLQKRAEQALGKEDASDARAEIGALLFSVVDLARRMNVDAEEALIETSKQFVSVVKQQAEE
jgi:tetrapyrrole methylase family protein/MazG family protein